MEKSNPLYFDTLSTLPGITHGVFTRKGGVSSPPFNSLNAGMGAGDDPANVKENRARMLAMLGADKAVFLHQVHGTGVHVMPKERINPEEFWDPDMGTTPLPVTADAVVTDEPGLALMIQVADCQAVLLYDPEKKVIGAVHSGWRGSVANMIGRCVEKMIHRFNCRPKDIRAGVSPSLGPCCAEFIHYKEEIPGSLHSYKIDGRPYFDFWQMSRDQLARCGVKPEHIEVMRLCTVCHPDLFFSYRREKITGRFAAGIALADN